MGDGLAERTQKGWVAKVASNPAGNPHDRAGGDVATVVPPRRGGNLATPAAVTANGSPNGRVVGNPSEQDELGRLADKGLV